jgi:hypothetical protein
MLALLAVLSESVRINAPATSGARLPPSELTACASVSRIGALSSGPRMET